MLRRRGCRGDWRAGGRVFTNTCSRVVTISLVPGCAVPSGFREPTGEGHQRLGVERAPRRHRPIRLAHCFIAVRRGLVEWLAIAAGARHSARPGRRCSARLGRRCLPHETRAPAPARPKPPWRALVDVGLFDVRPVGERCSQCAMGALRIDSAAWTKEADRLVVVETIKRKRAPDRSTAAPGRGGVTLRMCLPSPKKSGTVGTLTVAAGATVGVAGGRSRGALGYASADSEQEDRGKEAMLHWDVRSARFVRSSPLGKCLAPGTTPSGTSRRHPHARFGPLKTPLRCFRPRAKTALAVFTAAAAGAACAACGRGSHSDRGDDAAPPADGFEERARLEVGNRAGDDGASASAVPSSEARRARAPDYPARFVPLHNRPILSADLATRATKERSPPNRRARETSRFTTGVFHLDYTAFSLPPMRPPSVGDAARSAESLQGRIFFSRALQPPLPHGGRCPHSSSRALAGWTVFDRVIMTGADGSQDRSSLAPSSRTIADPALALNAEPCRARSHLAHFIDPTSNTSRPGY